jgi:transposase
VDRRGEYSTRGRGRQREPAPYGTGSEVLADSPDGGAGPDVLADVVVSKFGDHLPLHRLQEIHRRDGVELPRATLCDL